VVMPVERITSRYADRYLGDGAANDPA
jgi:hypothetical protein